MAIGDVRLPQTRQQQQRISVGADAFGAGVGRALGNLGASLELDATGRQQLVDMQRQRDERIENFNVQRLWVDYSAEQGRIQEERLRQAAETGQHQDLTNIVNTEVEAANEEFLNSIPERLRPEYGVRLAQLLNSQVSGAFTYSYEQGNAQFRADTEQATNDLATQVRQGSLNPDRALQELDELVEASDLPQLERDAFRQSALTLFRSIEFEQEIRIAREGGGTVRAATGEDVVAAGILPHERGFLNAVSRGESGDSYNVRFGGASGPQTFDNFDDHPRIFEQREDGRWSSAAGRYQFTATTWDQVAAELGLTSFSPENQDRAAIHLARQRYNAQRAGGLTFDQALQSGDPAIILSVRDTLAETWEAFQTMSDDEFINIVTGSAGIQGGGTGSAQFPDIWNDERYAGIPYDERVRLANAASNELVRLQEEQIRAAQLAHEQVREAAYLAAVQGQLNTSDTERLIDEGVLADASEVVRFEELARTGAARTQGAQEVGNQLGDPNYVFTGNDMNNLDAYVGEEGLASLRERDTGYTAGNFTPLVARTGVLPRDSGRILSGQLAGTDPLQQVFALETLSDIYQANRRAIENTSTLSGEQKEQVALFSATRGFSTPQEVLDLYQQSQDSTLRQGLETLQAEARDQFDGFSNRQLLNFFDPSLFVRGPDFPAARSQELRFRQEAEALYIQGYSILRDQEAARQYMVERLQTQWGSTRIGTDEPRLSRNPPERYYPQVDGSWHWIDFNLREELGLSEDQRYQLVADEQTQFEGDRFATGGAEFNASYTVALENEQGIFQLALTPEGRPRRFAFEISDLQQDLVRMQAEDSNLNERIRRLNREWVATEGVGEEADLLEEEIRKLQEQRRRMRDNARLLTGNRRSPFDLVNTPSERLATNRERQAEVQRQIDSLVTRSGQTLFQRPQLEEELRELREEEEALTNIQRGDIDG